MSTHKLAHLAYLDKDRNLSASSSLSSLSPFHPTHFTTHHRTTSFATGRLSVSVHDDVTPDPNSDCIQSTRCDLVSALQILSASNDTAINTQLAQWSKQLVGSEKWRVVANEYSGNTTRFARAVRSDQGVYLRETGCVLTGDDPSAFGRPGVYLRETNRPIIHNKTMGYGP